MPSPTGTSRTTRFANRSGDVRIDSLVDGQKWGGGLKQGVTLTYSFPGSGGPNSYWDNPYGSREPFIGLQYFTADEKAAARSALQNISMYANIRFTEVRDTATNVGDIRFTKTDVRHSGGETAFAYTPGATAEAGDIWFRNGGYNSLSVGTAGFGALLHEIGHAVGLKHPFEGGPRLPANLNHTWNTVMSYTGNNSPFYSLSPFDVQALQYIYGRNDTFNRTNTTYTYNTLVNLFDIDFAGTGSLAAVTLWDAGGIDTLIGGHYSDLRTWQGATSYQYSATEIRSSSTFPNNTIQVKLAPGAVIENATLTSTNGTYSVILGNNANNVLRGKVSGTETNYSGLEISGFNGNDSLYSHRVIATDTSNGFPPSNSLFGDAGNDRLYGFIYTDNLFGGAGNDLLIGGAGADKLSGGRGIDTASYSGSDDGIYIDLVEWDAPRAIEYFEDANPPDRFSPQIYFYGEADFATAMYGHAAGDLIVGVENIVGSGFADYIEGDSFANVLDGGGGGDILYGWTGNDTLIGGAGDDFMNGQSGVDTVSYAAEGPVTVRLLDSGRQDTGSSGLDQIIDVENLIGSRFGDYLTGSEQNNRLDGGASSDRLFGLGGADVLIGGAGRDFMTGGEGLDDFKFNAVGDIGNTASTRDRILDFSHLQDDIDLSAIDANGTAPGSTAFRFLAAKGAAFTGTKGQLRWFQDNRAGTANDKTIIEGDLNGDKRADFQIELTGIKAITSADFLL